MRALRGYLRGRSPGAYGFAPASCNPNAGAPQWDYHMVPAMDSTAHLPPGTHCRDAVDLLAAESLPRAWARHFAVTPERTADFLR